jgi:O-antigen/teichoic acid export membrane protein
VTSTATTLEPAAPETRLKTDTLAQSVIVLVVLTILQRGLGFVRSLLFCRWLEPAELGQWDLAYGFLLLAAPVAVLGLPGCFGRYLEHYRSRGQTKVFLRRIGWCVLGLACASTAIVYVGRAWFGELVFGHAAEELAAWLAVCLVMLIAYNFLCELFGGLRMFRLVSVLQFVQSAAFAAFGIALVLGWNAGTRSLLIAFAAACLACNVLGLVWARQAWKSLGQPTAALAARTMWARLLPFAAWLWATNWLANVFDVADRYLLLHFSSLDAVAAAEAVGNYHAARVLPLPMVGLATLVQSALLPHLSHDWESGRRNVVGRRLNLALKLLGLGFLAGGALLLVAGPWVFAAALEDKYSGGLEILSGTIAYLAWAALINVAANYLWCAERPGLVCLALASGLAINVPLNILLVPHFGLWGAVLATGAARLAALGALLLLSRRLGMHIEPATWTLVAATGLLCLGPLVSLAVLIVLVHQVVTRNGLLSHDEKEQLLDVYRKYVRRLKPPLNDEKTTLDPAERSPL